MYQVFLITLYSSFLSYGFLTTYSVSLYLAFSEQRNNDLSPENPPNSRVISRLDDLIHLLALHLYLPIRYGNLCRNLVWFCPLAIYRGMFGTVRVIRFENPISALFVPIFTLKLVLIHFANNLGNTVVTRQVFARRGPSATMGSGWMEQTSLQRSTQSPGAYIWRWKQRNNA